MIDRRHFLSLATTVSIATLLPRDAGAQATPPSATPDGFRILEARRGKLRLAPDPAGETEILGYDGIAPGPLLRIKQGEELKLRLTNKLLQPTALHFRGIRVPNAMDGSPGLTQAAIAPGKSFDYAFTPPDSGMFFYHASALPEAAEQVAMGMSGLLIVDEAEPPKIDREMIVSITDWRLDDKGISTPDTPSDAAGTGRIGKLVTVNGKPTPETAELAPGSRVRLRIVNAAVARIMILTFDNVRPMIIAIDGQPCTAFEPVRRSIPVGPGARFDVLIDLPREDKQESSLILRALDGVTGEAERKILVLKTAGKPREALPDIVSLPPNAALPPIIRLQDAKRLDLAIAPATPANGKIADPRKLWMLGGVASDGAGGKPLFSVKRGSPVTLGFVNASSIFHQMHIHGHHVRQLHLLDDGWEPYWRDAVIVPPQKTVRIAFIADNPGKWRIASGLLNHAAAGLAGWFEVT